MNPQSPLPPTDSNQYTNQIQSPQQYSPYSQTPPPLPAKSKKPVIIIALIVLLFAAAAGAWYLTSKNKKVETANTPASVSGEETVKTDKQDIQKAVDTYCQKLGKVFGFAGMNSGYIISDRYSEEVLSDSPKLLRFKQVGNAASATVDCIDARGPNGISNDLLFVKKDGSWTYVDEEQNNAGSGFVCSIVEQYNVSKELVSECAQPEGQKTHPR